MTRLQNFKAWFKHLKQEGNNMNCCIWAFHNSGTHFTDGTYFKKGKRIEQK